MKTVLAIALLCGFAFARPAHADYPQGRLHLTVWSGDAATRVGPDFEEAYRREQWGGTTTCNPSNFLFCYPLEYPSSNQVELKVTGNIEYDLTRGLRLGLGVLPPWEVRTTGLGGQRNSLRRSGLGVYLSRDHGGKRGWRRAILSTGAGLGWHRYEFRQIGDKPSLRPSGDGQDFSRTALVLVGRTGLLLYKGLSVDFVLDGRWVGGMEAQGPVGTHTVGLNELNFLFGLSYHALGR